MRPYSRPGPTQEPEVPHAVQRQPCPDSLQHLRDVALQELQQIEGVRSAETIVLLDEIDRRNEPIWDSSGAPR